MKKLLSFLMLAAFSLGVNAQQSVMLSTVEAKRSTKSIQTNRVNVTTDKSDVTKLPESTNKRRISNQLHSASLPAPSYIKQPGQKAITPGHAKIILTIGDVWGDGTGYQMLIDADADTYGTIIPVEGALGAPGDIPDDVYDEFEYKIPVNADGSLTTTNIVLNDAVAIEIPAGTYDYCITNPTPGDRVWIAGGEFARVDDFVFEDGKAYIFSVILKGQGDLAILSYAIAEAPSDITGLTATAVGQTLDIDLSWTNPTLTMEGDDLTELTSVVVERNGTVVHTLSAPVIGAAVTWTDNVPAEGSYTYTVYGVNSSGNGPSATATAFAGNVILMGSVPAVNSCGTSFTDDGGPAENYAVTTDENYIQAICFSPDVANNLVRATFTEFNTTVDLDADVLYIVNGSYTDINDIPNDAVIDAIYGDLTSALPLSYISDSPDGALTFVFIRDSWGFYPPASGWMADMDCVTPSDNDAGVTAVLSPISATSDSYNLSVKVKNFGVNTITSMDIKYEVDGATAVTETYTGNLGMLETDDFHFATPITFSDYGTAKVKVYTDLASDENPDNNTSEIVIVYRPAVTLYAYRAYGGDLGFVSFESNEAQNINTEKLYANGSNGMRGGDYLNGELYAYTVSGADPANFVKLTEDWNEISSVPTNGAPFDVSYDHSTGTMYAIAAKNLYTVDKLTGEFAEVTTTLPENFLTIACDLSGQLYGITTEGNFYSINKTTGAATLINSTGYIPEYVQSMAFDHNTGRLFWAYIDSEGVISNLMEVDPATGECVNLGSLGSTMSQLMMLYSPYINSAIPEAPANFVATPDATGALSCELTWKNPSLTTDGTTLTELTSIVIRRNNVIVQTISTPTIGATASWTDNSMTDGGNYTYSIYGVNSVGEGLVATQNVRVGCVQAINTFPWDMDFEENLIPGCWVQEYVSGNGANWVTDSGNNSYPADAHGGSYNAVFKNTNSTTSDIVKLITPKLNITGLTTPELSFWYVQTAWSGDQDELRIYYKTSASGAWTLLKEYIDDIQDWTEEIITLPDASDDYYIAFEGTANYGRGIALDDISVYDSDLNGIDNTSSEKYGLRVYPNPVTNGKLIVEGNMQETGSRSVIRLYDLAGNTAGTFTATGNSTTIDISHLPAGTYILKLNEKVAKIVKN